MAIPITVPRLGWNMEQGVFIGWLKADGAAICAGESVFTLESEKATEDVECLENGILHIPANGPRQGDTVAVGAVVGYVLQPGETIPEVVTPLPAPQRGAPTSASVDAVPSAAAAHTRDRLASSPRARRAAARLGIDWTQAKGTGHSGRIRERDVLMLHAKTETPAAASIGSVRRVIAERMLASQRSTAPVSLIATIDATELVHFRNRCKTGAAGGAGVPSYTDLFVTLAAIALAKHPALNTRWDNDHIVTCEGIHVGIAVDTNAGLLVPVVRDVLQLSLKELSTRSRDLIERARRGKLSASELSGGTFTVTSLGAFGIDAFTPIINHPECAILGIGRIRRCPAVIDEQIVIRDQVTLSLTFDHRITDGVPAARFLQTLAGLVENPDAVMSEPEA
jgi:pyruvate dehydrogenase E2 component (dihydrolipoamide acetyltransferase)